MKRRAIFVLSLLFLPAPRALPGEGEVRLLTDDSIPRYLARGRELARAKKWDKMVDVLQRVIVGDPEIFPDLKPELLHAAVYTEDGKTYYPARELCLRELAALPEEGLRAYRDVYDSKARALHAEAEGVDDLLGRLAAYTRVFDKYLVSSVGDDALEKAGDINLALGRHYEALSLFRRLLNIYPRDTDRDRATVLVKAAYCAVRIGDLEQRNRLLDRLVRDHPTARIRVEGKLLTAPAVADHPRLAPSEHPAGRTGDADWPMAGGEPSRARVIEDLAGDLPPDPFWRHPLGARDSRLVVSPERSSRWMVVVHDRDRTPRPARDNIHSHLSPYPTVRPILKDGRVYYKDGIELVARRVSSGAYLQPRGRYKFVEFKEDPSFRYPLRFVRPGSENAGRQGQQYEDIHRWLDYGGAGAVAVADHVYVVENETPLSYLLGERVPQPPAGGNLLAAYRSRDGRLMWGWSREGNLTAMNVRSEPETYDSWQADFQRHQHAHFRGPGVPSGGMLYTVAHEAHEAKGLKGISLWGLDLRDGRVRFRTQIHHLDEIPQRLPLGAGLAVAGGAVYVVTQAGVVAAVDALPPGRVRWITRYRRNYVQQAGGRRRPRRSRIQQGFAYNEPVVAAGKVIAAPADSKEVIAFHAETGRVAWRIDASEMREASHIVGVSSGVLVMGGDKVYGFDVGTGEPLWGPARLDAFAYGRGCVGTRYAYIPTTRTGQHGAAIRKIDLKTGEPAGSLEFNVEKLGNLIALDGRLVVANDQEVMCFTSLAAEIGRIDERIEAGGETAELRLERALVSLAADPPRRDQAREDFRRALALRADREIRQWAIENLFALAGQKSYLDALEEALEIAASAGDPHSRRLYEAQAKFLRVSILAATGRAQEAFDELEVFLDSFQDDKVVDAHRKVRRAPAAAREVRAELIRRNEAFKEIFEKRVRERIRAAYEKKDEETLRALPARYDRAAPTEESYFALARLLSEEGDLPAAELALRTLIRDFPEHPSRGEAHLRLARMLLDKGLVEQAKRERDEGMSRIDLEARGRLAALISTLDRGLVAEKRPLVLPRLGLPLRASPLGRDDLAPVPIEGGLPGITLLADMGTYVALDAEGRQLWSRPIPGAGTLTPGPADDPETTIVAAAVAEARFARAVDGHLVVGDLCGVMRLDPQTGNIVWQHPKIRGTASVQAERLLKALQNDIYVLRKEDELTRRNRMPVYAVAGDSVVSVHPLRGVEVVSFLSGERVWADHAGFTAPFGRPQILGQLLVVGWAAPGRARVYALADGRVLREHLLEEGENSVLFGPPRLDPEGRLYLVGGTDLGDLKGELRIVDARSGAPAHRTYPVHSRHAAVLHADGRQAVFHDGGSGNENLHFIDLKSNTVVSRRAADLLREVAILEARGRLFVFTHTMGVEELGARLFRVDLAGKDSLTYEFEFQGTSYPRPVLTRHHVVAGGVSATGAILRLYDREASADSRGPRNAFQEKEGGELTGSLMIPGRAATRRATAAVVIVAGESLVFSTPFGCLRLRGPGAR